MDQEMNITEYTVEPEMEKVLTDFYVKPYPDVREVLEDPHPIIPLHYYDNDDGFWDEYIKEKHDRWGQHDMITNRRFFKH
jgi:hypothetical protein